MNFGSSFSQCGGPLDGIIHEQLGEKYLVVRELVANIPTILALWQKLQPYADLGAVLDAKLDTNRAGIANGWTPLNAQAQVSAVFLPGGSVEAHIAAADPHAQYLTVARGDARYAILGVDNRITAAQLPSFVDDVIEAPTVSDFPAVGEAGKIYVTTNADPAIGNKTYRWTGTQYFPVGDGNGLSNVGSTDSLVEGTTNFYHTPARVRAVTLTGLDSTTAGTVAASDTLLVAIGKLQRQASDNATAIGTRASQADLTALSQVVSGKADAVHSHGIGSVTNLQSVLDGKQSKVLVGTSAPANALGSDGDIYFRVS